LNERDLAGSLAGVSITAIVENDTIKLPVHVPDGTRVEITLSAESGAEEDELTLYETLKDHRPNGGIAGGFRGEAQSLHVGGAGSRLAALWFAQREDDRRARFR
jgi:hypothetical protein